MNIKASKRELNKEVNMSKLIEAMDLIIEKYDFNTLTIRNICNVSGISYGSFYHLFETKEKFLTYYLTNDFVKYEQGYYEDNEAFEKMTFLEKSVDIFVTCARYNVQKGIHFISAFYSPKNYDLSPLNKKGNYFCFTPLVNEGLDLLRQAQEVGDLEKNVDLNQIVTEYCYIFNASTFNWCISNGQMDMIRDVQMRLTEYINKWLKER